jgi:hypothetical protein
MNVIFCKGKSWTANLIASIDDTDVSHVALASWKLMDRNLILHSTGKGVNITTKSTFLKHYDIKREYEIPVNDEFSESFILWKMIEKYEGAPYDYFALIYLGLFLLGKKLGIRLPPVNRWQNKNHYICTEFATLAIMGNTNSMSSLKSLEKYILEKFATNDSRLSFF